MAKIDITTDPINPATDAKLATWSYALFHAGNDKVYPSSDTPNKLITIKEARENYGYLLFGEDSKIVKCSQLVKQSVTPTPIKNTLTIRNAAMTDATLQLFDGLVSGNLSNYPIMNFISYLEFEYDVSGLSVYSCRSVSKVNVSIGSSVYIYYNDKFAKSFILQEGIQTIEVGGYVGPAQPIS